MFSFQSTQKANALIALVRGPKFSLFPSRRCCLHIWLGSSRLLRITPTKYPTADYLSRTETASHPDFNPNDFDELGIRKDRYYKYRRLSDKVAYWLYISALVMMGSLFLFYFGIFLYAAWPLPDNQQIDEEDSSKNSEATLQRDKRNTLNENF